VTKAGFGRGLCCLLALINFCLRLNFPDFRKNDSRFKTPLQLIFMIRWSEWLILSAARGHSDELLISAIVTNLTRPAKRVVRFYNQRGTAEQWIKEGKNAVKWTRLSCHDFVDNQVRLHLFVLAYNLGNFLRQAVLPKAVRHWTLTTLREKLIKIGAKVVRHSRKIVFQMAEVAVPRELFQTILERIGRLRLATAMSG
jgi:Transposase DDE domain group 1